jgi:oligopeptide transport system substrate-binding protein
MVQLRATASKCLHIGGPLRPNGFGIAERLSPIRAMRGSVWAQAIVREFESAPRLKNRVVCRGKRVVEMETHSEAYRHRRVVEGLIALLLAASLGGCGGIWNDPYPATERSQNILYSAFTERPKHLDAAQSYSEDEATFHAQIYEPPVQYHFLKRPYTLVPMTTETMPAPRFVDAEGQSVAGDAPNVAFSLYDIRIKRGILYQPHPAFARDASGKLRYGSLAPADLKNVYTLSDFKETGTRELIAADYVYEIKRLASPRLSSPILGLMSEHIVGLAELAKELAAADATLAAKGDKDIWLDLSKYDLAGVEELDRYTFRIKIKGRYAQFVYWLAMNFFAPVPIEVDRFYAQKGMAAKNLTLDWYPVGTGPYMLSENNPNARIVLERNPNYHGERYPEEGEPQDTQSGLLADAGKPIPFIDKVVFSREREGIPYWNKFLQGYYDSSSISSDNFDQAVRISVGSDAAVTPEIAAKGITLDASVAASTRYMAFNWLDAVVGGTAEPARKIRQAISIAIDWEEYISIFNNGRGIAGQGPIPPGVYGYRDGDAGINGVVYDDVKGKPRRKSIEEARRLVAEAGYPGGRDAKTGQPLVLYLDTTSSGPDDKPAIDWYVKQFRKLDVQLEVRDTDYNRFQDKIRNGSVQIFRWGWNADYPDPENFLFLFHSSQRKVPFQGENAANYTNPEFDRLFDQMKDKQNSPERQALIDRMVVILREDAPWSFGYHSKDYTLHHGWLSNLKPNQMARNSMKYRKVDVVLRERWRAEWNKPVVWPLAFVAFGLVAMVTPALRNYRRRERRTASVT